jgi:hypothetical protein
MGGGETLHHELQISTPRVPEKMSLRVRRRRLGGMWPHQDGASCIQVARNAHYPQSVSSDWEGNGYSRAIITDPGGWLHSNSLARS